MSYNPGLSRAVDALITDFFPIHDGEEVLITADLNTDRNLTYALLEGVGRRGAKGSVFLMPPLPYQGGLADPYIPAACGRAVANVTAWIDATFPYMAGCHIQDELMKQGKARYLLLGDPDGAAVGRLFADADLDRYYDAQGEFDAIFGQAVGKTCRIACPNGSDVTFQIAKPGINKPRRADKPGMYVVPGSCSIPPEPDTVRGRIAIASVFHTFYEVLAQPIIVHVDGAITGIEGHGASAINFERAVRRAVSEGMGKIIHFTHGLHPTARLTRRSFIEDMRVIGNNAVGFGLPWWVPGGGENHPDGVMFGHSVWIEEKQIVKDGQVVWPETLKQKAARLMDRNSQ